MRIHYALFLMLVFLTLPAFPAAAGKIVELTEGRDVTVFKENEIPRYLRDDHCKQYVYKESMPRERLIQDGSGDIELLPEPGSMPEDIEIFSDEEICLISLVESSRIQDENEYIELYQVQPFGNNAPATIRATKNKKELKNGEYSLESGLHLNVRDGLVFSSSGN